MPAGTWLAMWTLQRNRTEVEVQPTTDCYTLSNLQWRNRTWKQAPHIHHHEYIQNHEAWYADTFLLKIDCWDCGRKYHCWWKGWTNFLLDTNQKCGRQKQKQQTHATYYFKHQLGITQHWHEQRKRPENLSLKPCCAAFWLLESVCCSNKEKMFAEEQPMDLATLLSLNQLELQASISD